LHPSEPTRYSLDAAAKSVAGIDVPQNTMATLPASSMLIDVIALAHLQFMVAQAGISQEALVYIVFWGLIMFDETPLTIEEVVDHCRALAFSIIEIQHPVVKEILMFILCERLDLLNDTLDMEFPDE
jgi:hypothetical protein